MYCCISGDLNQIRTQNILTLPAAAIPGHGLPQSSNGQTSKSRITTVDQETLKARLYFPAEKRQVMRGQGELRNGRSVNFEIELC